MLGFGRFPCRHRRLRRLGVGVKTRNVPLLFLFALLVSLLVQYDHCLPRFLRYSYYRFH